LKNAPYLQGVDDDENCAASPHYRWVTIFTPAQIRKLEVEGLEGVLLHIRIKEATPLGVVTKMELQTSLGSSEMTGYEFYRLVGQTLGWDLIKSVNFKVAEKNGRIIISGRGLGHGIGLCQWGAMGLADKDKKYPEILKFYFPGTEVITWDGELPQRD
jgi:stage II sporulation protein D